MYAEKALTKVDRNYARAIRRMNILKNKMDRASDIYNARKEGLIEGKAEANLEIARKALAEGVTSEVIQKITGLDRETIEKLNPS